MSRWGLAYKTFQVLWPDEWNALVDALNELCGSFVVVIPACGSALVFDAGAQKSVLPFMGELDFPQPFALPFSLKAKRLVVHVYDNSLDGKTLIYVRKNREVTDLYVSVDAEGTGVFSTDVDGIDFAVGDGIDFLVDTTDALGGSIKFASISAMGFYILPVSP